MRWAGIAVVLAAIGCDGPAFTTDDPLFDPAPSSGDGGTEASVEAATGDARAPTDDATSDVSMQSESSSPEAALPDDADPGDSSPVVDDAASPLDAGPTVCSYAPGRFSVDPPVVEDDAVYSSVAHDAKTGLSWMVYPSGAGPNNQPTGPQYCGSFAPPWYTWRIPTLQEMLTIALPGCHPAYDRSVFSQDSLTGIYYTTDVTRCYDADRGIEAVSCDQASGLLCVTN